MGLTNRMYVVVVGGFERSGHDAIADALAAEGSSRGHTVRSWKWREGRPGIEENLIFTMHRHAGRMGSPALAGVMGNEALVTALTDDLLPILEASSIREADAIISVHPWSTLALAHWLEGTPGPALVDCHSDFTPFPVFPHPRVDAFIGTGRAEFPSAEVSRRIHPLGLPVRSSFSSPSQVARARTLVVNAGSDAWAVRGVAATVPIVSRLLQPESVILLAPTEDSARAWADLVEPDQRTQIVKGLSDTGPLLCASSWLLTKAGGVPIAEGIAAGCTVLAIPTGIAWEDDSLAWMAMQGEIVPVGGNFPHEWSALLLEYGGEREPGLRSLLSESGGAIWRHLEAGCPPRTNPELETVQALLDLDNRARQDGALPKTSERLRELLEGWLAMDDA